MGKTKATGTRLAGKVAVPQKDEPPAKKRITKEEIKRRNAKLLVPSDKKKVMTPTPPKSDTIVISSMTSYNSAKPTPT